MPAIQAAIILACIGGGTAVKPDIATTYGSESGTFNYGRGALNRGYGSYDGSYNSTYMGTRDRQFADQVDVELTGSEGRIRLPRVVLPMIHGGDGGWFQLKNLQVTDREITGSAAINVINHPKVRIDRVTGAISINGKVGDYTGRCEAVQANAQRKF